MDKNKIDLNAPAFGPGSQSLEDLMNNRTPEETSVETQQENKVEEENVEPSVEENKVSYSRFKTVHQRAIEAEAEAERWRLKAEQIEQNRSKTVEEPSGDMPDYWKELYGDSEASEKAWKIQQRREEEIERRAYEAGQRGAQELRQIEKARIEENVSVIDQNLEALSALVGRDLTEKEQSALLDIVDNYTAKDDDGNYLGAIMPFEKAWEIYELKQGSNKSQQRSARDSVASLSGINTQGETSVQAEKDKNFNPLDWNSYKRRI